MAVEFTGKISGDCECFCWEVTEETFKSICGVREWMDEKKEREEELLEHGYVRPWRIYPGNVLPRGEYDDDGEPKEMKFTIEATPIE